MLTVDMKGMQVQVVVNTWKNNNWIASTILGPVTINISESIPVITEHPKGGVAEAPEQPKPAKPGEITIVFGRQYLFKVTASGSNIKYQWQISSDNGRTFVDIPYATKNSTGLKVEKENNGKLVRCVVSNEYGSAVSNAARLTVYYQPKFADKISDTTVNAGEKAAFTMSVTEGNPTGVEVTWQVSRDDGETYSDVTENGKRRKCVDDHVRHLRSDERVKRQCLPLHSKERRKRRLCGHMALGRGNPYGQQLYREL